MQDTNVSVCTAHLTRDPELRSTPSGKSVCTMRVAIGRRSGPRGEDRGAAFLDVQTWGKTAENCAKYLAKGRQVVVTGRIDQDEWEYKGEKYQRVYVVAEQVQFLRAPERTASADDALPDAAEPQPEPAAPAADVEPEPAAAA